MHNTWKRNCSVGMALLMGGSLLLGGCGSNGAQDAVETSAVVVDMKQAQTGKLTLQNSFVGTVSPQEMVYVIPFASGTVTDTYFEVGDQVNAGDVLFKIDDSAAKLQLEQAQLSAANVRQQADSALTTQQESANIQMDSSRVQAQSGYDQAQIAYVQAKNAYDQNYDDLSDQIDACNANITQLENAIKAASSSVSGGNASSVVQMKTQIETLKGTKKQLESSRNSLVAGLQQAESAYNAAKSSMNIVDRSQALSQGQALEDTKKQLSTSEQLANVGVESAELALSYYTVKAPISGTIQSKGVEVNGIAGSSNPAYTIANENMMTVTFQVSEAVKNTLTMGQEVTVERGNASYTGNITEIGVAVNQQTGLFQIKAAVNADGQHDADRRGRQQCDLAAAVDRVPAETADDHVKQQRQHRQRQHRHPRRRLFGRIFFHFRIPINHTDGKNTKNLPHIRTPGTGDNHFRPEDMRVQLFRAHCFLFPKFYLFLVKDSDGYGGTNNQKDLPVLPRRVPEHDSRQNPVGHHPGQAVHPVRNPQGILFSRFPGRAEPRRAQPFGHERTNPRQITIAYVI